jgi:hypothetical protein
MGAGKAAVTGDTSAIGGEIARQQADTAAARQRIGPTGRLITDIAGQVGSPANAIGASMPFGVGPMAQGMVQEGVKSLGEGKDLQTSGENAVLGGLTGLGSTVASQAVRPSVVRNALGYGVEMAPTFALGHLIGGGWEHGLVGAALSPMTPLHKVGEAIRGIWPNADWTPARAAFQNLLFGTGTSAINQRPPGP